MSNLNCKSGAAVLATLMTLCIVSNFWDEKNVNRNKVTAASFNVKDEDYRVTSVSDIKSLTFKGNIPNRDKSSIMDPKVELFIERSLNYGVKEHELIYFQKILRVLDNAATELGINYFLASGSLLGLWRHGGLIPWDDDLDIAVDEKDGLALSNFLNGTDGWQVEFTKYQHYKLSSTTNYVSEIPGQMTTWPFMDIFLTVPLSDGTLRVGGFNFRYNDANIYQKLQRRTFMGVSVLTPEKIESGLVPEYGGAIRDQCLLKDYDHRLDRAMYTKNKSSSVVIECKELFGFFNFSKEFVGMTLEKMGE